MGLFSRDPVPSSSSASSGRPAKNALDGPDRDLPSPGLPPDHPRQLAWRLLDDCGLTYCFTGPGSPTEVFSALTAIAPVMRTTELHSPYLGSIPHRRDFMWTAYAGPSNSIIAISCFPDGDSRWLLDVGIGGFSPAPAPFRWGFGTRHAHLPAMVVDQIERGVLVDLRPLLGLAVPESDRPERKTPPMSEDLDRRVIAAGWERMGDEVFKKVFPGMRDRTQVVFLLATEADGWCVCSPVADAPEGLVPADLVGGQHAYELDVFASVAVLRSRLDGEPDEPNDRTILKSASALARYADGVELEREGTDRF